MRPIPVLLQLLSVPMTVWSSQSPLVIATLDDGLEVPGQNTLTYCEDTSNYIFDIEYINLNPQTPERGKNLTIEAAGISSQTIDIGAKFFVNVKRGYVTILQKEYEFCDVIGAVNLSCPLEEGYRKVIKEVEIPSWIPSGRYVFTVEGYTPQREMEMTCFQGSVVF